MGQAICSRLFSGLTERAFFWLFCQRKGFAQYFPITYNKGW